MTTVQEAANIFANKLHRGYYANFTSSQISHLEQLIIDHGTEILFQEVLDSGNLHAAKPAPLYEVAINGATNHIRHGDSDQTKAIELLNLISRTAERFTDEQRAELNGKYQFFGHIRQAILRNDHAPIPALFDIFRATSPQRFWEMMEHGYIELDMYFPQRDSYFHLAARFAGTEVLSALEQSYIRHYGDEEGKTRVAALLNTRNHFNSSQELTPLEGIEFVRPQPGHLREDYSIPVTPKQAEVNRIWITERLTPEVLASVQRRETIPGFYEQLREWRNGRASLAELETLKAKASLFTAEELLHHIETEHCKDHLFDRMIAIAVELLRSGAAPLRASGVAMKDWLIEMMESFDEADQALLREKSQFDRVAWTRSLMSEAIELVITEDVEAAREVFALFKGLLPDQFKAALMDQYAYSVSSRMNLFHLAGRFTHPERRDDGSEYSMLDLLAETIIEVYGEEEGNRHIHQMLSTPCDLYLRNRLLWLTPEDFTRHVRLDGQHTEDEAFLEANPDAEKNAEWIRNRQMAVMPHEERVARQLYDAIRSSDSELFDRVCAAAKSEHLAEYRAALISTDIDGRRNNAFHVAARFGRPKILVKIAEEIVRAHGREAGFSHINNMLQAINRFSHTPSGFAGYTSPYDTLYSAENPHAAANRSQIERIQHSMRPPEERIPEEIYATLRRGDLNGFNDVVERSREKHASIVLEALTHPNLGNEINIFQLLVQRRRDVALAERAADVIEELAGGVIAGRRLILPLLEQAHLGSAGRSALSSKNQEVREIQEWASDYVRRAERDGFRMPPPNRSNHPWTARGKSADSEAAEGTGAGEQRTRWG